MASKPKRRMPPPPMIGGVRKPISRKRPVSGPSKTAEQDDPDAEKAEDDAKPDADSTEAKTGDEPGAANDTDDDSATSRWPRVKDPIASDDASPSVPEVRPRPRVPSGASTPPPIDASASSSGLRAPSIKATPAVAVGDGASSWPQTDGWDFDDLEGVGEADAGETKADDAEKDSRLPPPPVSRPPATPTPPPSETLEEDGAPSLADLIGEAAVPEPEAPPEPPKLPVPGMLRDGAMTPVSDFRAARPRPISGPPSSTAPKGMVPPKPSSEEEDGASSKLATGDTMSFMAQVAAELMEEEDAEGSTVTGQAAADGDESDEGAAAVSASGAAVSVAAAAAASTPAAEAPEVVDLPPPPATAPADDEAKRRGMLMGMGLVGAAAVIGLFVWLATGDSDDPPQTAAAPAPMAPAKSGEDAAPTDDDSKSPAAAPVPDVAAAASTGETAAGSTGVDEAGSTSGTGTGESGDGSTGEAEEAGSTGETEAGSDDGTAQPIADATPRSPRKPKGKPQPQPKPQPKPPPAAPEKEDPAKLLSQARAAYKGGKGSSAYTLASRSHRLRPSEAAAELMVMAACQSNNASKAKGALKKVPLLKRPNVRSKCKSKHGVKIPL